MTTVLIARPRLHMGLADMALASARVYGGIGFALDVPETVLEFQVSDNTELNGFDALDANTQHDLLGVCERIASRSTGRGFRATLRAIPKQHVGFGTKTSLALGLLAGVNATLDLGLSRTEMQWLSGRGGASGIGVHSFFEGGVIWDCGHAREDGLALTPSSASKDRQIPPLMLRLPFPTAWRVALVLPDDPPAYGTTEVRFFAEHAPIPPAEALSTIAALYHGVLPAIRLADLDALAAALREIHATGFKQREVCARSPKTQRVFSELHRTGIAAGMSSLGPLIYAVVPESDKDALARVGNVSRSCGTPLLGIARGWNAGYQIRMEPDQ